MVIPFNFNSEKAVQDRARELGDNPRGTNHVILGKGEGVYEIVTACDKGWKGLQEV